MGGRPDRINAIHGYDPDTGNEITIGDALCAHLRNRNFLETACHLVGVEVATVRGWLRDGARAHERLLAGAATRQLTAYQRRAAAFSLAARRAMAEAEVGTVEMLSLIARGGIPQTTVTVKTEARRGRDGRPLIGPDDQPIYVETERRTVHSRTLPDAASLRWFLERRYPDRWRAIDRVDIDLHIEDLEDTADPLDEFLADIASIARRKTEAMAQLEAAGAGDIIDVQPIDPTAPIDLGEDP
jgi:hypothetical protein